ncbi:monovalent cation/H(+) antiporter subunit G [Leucobacter chinensis]|uniref:monovalent cation/H(+) antiporter subunit G n=1 Tax=Leucobacter chinensis TaxID=2851010 RepID=UPI001C2264A9|nr:monovalent cation/H(+) antiporter subunit G [Leucobacter chinensis]
MSDFFTVILPALLLLGASLLSVAAGVGLLRFTDVLTKLHAVTKPQVLGLILVILAIVLSMQSWVVFFALLPVFVFQSLTAPVAAHMVGRASYRTGDIDTEHLLVDELAPAVAEVPEDADTDAEEEADGSTPQVDTENGGA